MRKLFILGALILVVGLAAVQGGGNSTAEAAKPTVEVTQIELRDEGSCNITSHVTWNGSKFGHKKGKLQFELIRSGQTITAPFIDISAGMLPTWADPMDESYSWGSRPSTTYTTRVNFYTTRGKDSLVTGRLVSSALSDPIKHVEPICP